jgi:large subunit ribosomal protein L17
MHRHSYQGRKLGRKRDTRRALLKTMAVSLIKEGSIQTTVPKAKELVPFIEKLISKSKVGTLHSRRLIIARLGSEQYAHQLVDVIAPQLKRDSGHVRLVREGFRRGDNAELARVSFVDEIDLSVKSEAK